MKPKTVGICFVIEREKYTNELRDKGYALAVQALTRGSHGVRGGTYRFSEETPLPADPIFYAYYDYEDASDS